jgi:hypothetical protein
VRRRRRWEEQLDDDPAAGLLNLFDVWIAFAAALLLAFASYRAAESASPRPDAASAARPDEKSMPIDSFKVSDDRLHGEGERLGTAYRLTSGEVVYVPDPPAR